VLLPLKNGGRGPALNVHGWIESHTPEGERPYRRQILATTIAANDLFNARISPNSGVQHWIGATAIIRYCDMSGRWYETSFKGARGPGGEIELLVDEPADLGIRVPDTWPPNRE
jgi:hypothetical protein